ncbi:MAG: PaaI family thioesterase [Streptosporangiales bacterium]|nr:PaaI family thioesterase [Streptosporangiales bacterium]
MRRDNEFWDVVASGGPLPAAAETLGFELVSANPDEGTVEVAFNAEDRFLNPAGAVQGGFLAAMLDDTLGPALVSTLERGQFAPTADLHVQFLRPARPGRLTGRGRIVRRGKSIAFLSGELSDETGNVVAVATATAVVQNGAPGKP